MTLRTRLIIAFLLLSVLPLTAVTLLSYQSSVGAFERAAEREATQSAADVSRRMDIVTADLGRRVDRIFAGASDAGEPNVRENVAPALGDTAALVDRLRASSAPAAGGVGGTGTAGRSRTRGAAGATRAGDGRREDHGRGAT